MTTSSLNLLKLLTLVQSLHTKSQDHRQKGAAEANAPGPGLPKESELF